MTSHLSVEEFIEKWFYNIGQPNVVHEDEMKADLVAMLDHARNGIWNAVGGLEHGGRRAMGLSPARPATVQDLRDAPAGLPGLSRLRGGGLRHDVPGPFPVGEGVEAHPGRPRRRRGRFRLVDDGLDRPVHLEDLT